MSFTDELSTRLQAKQREWEKCKEEMRIVKEKDSRLRDEISAIQVLLNAEQPRDRKATNNVVSVGISTVEIKNGNKAEAVRTLIRQNASAGLTPPRIRELLAQSGVHVGASYIYGILMRAKKTGEFSERNGRYYPAEKEKVAS
jgi:hypothetical protein